MRHRSLALHFDGLLVGLGRFFLSLGQEARALGWNFGKNELTSRLKDGVWFGYFQFFWAGIDLTFLP